MGRGEGHGAGEQAQGLLYGAEPQRQGSGRAGADLWLRSLSNAPAERERELAEFAACLGPDFDRRDLYRLKALAGSFPEDLGILARTAAARELEEEEARGRRRSLELALTPRPRDDSILVIASGLPRMVHMTRSEETTICSRETSGMRRAPSLAWLLHVDIQWCFGCGLSQESAFQLDEAPAVELGASEMTKIAARLEESKKTRLFSCSLQTDLDDCHELLCELPKQGYDLAVAEALAKLVVQGAGRRPSAFGIDASALDPYDLIAGLISCLEEKGDFSHDSDKLLAKIRKIALN